MIQSLLGILGFIILFLFFLFSFIKEDFIFFRRNISIEKIFNIAFLTLFISFLVSRLFFVIFHFSPIYLNPLVFLAFPYFPGFSLVSGLLGGIVFLLFLRNIEKLPIVRTIDFFIVSVTGALGVIKTTEFILEAFLTKKILPGLLLESISYLLLLFFAFKLLKKEMLKEGTFSGIFFILVSLVYIFESFSKNHWKFSFKDGEIYIYILLILFSIIYLLMREKVIGGKRKP